MNPIALLKSPLQSDRMQVMLELTGIYKVNFLRGNRFWGSADPAKAWKRFIVVVPPSDLPYPS
ncbi:MAG: hypothetical protein QW379_09545 [Thermoplasmata archaeon]